MKINLSIIAVLLLLVMSSCKEGAEKQLTIEQQAQKPQTKENIEIVEPEINLDKIETNFMKWWTYHLKTISLSTDFNGLDENSENISKKLFLEKLTLGYFIPLKLKVTENNEQYKLFRLSSKADASIKTTIKNEALTYLKYHNMEGTRFPKFNFEDINGKHFANETTLGKIVVIKTWFINCVACVAEFPELNTLIKKYKNRSDIEFLSLALDSKQELKEFLKSKVFDYRVISNQEELIKQKLKLQIYPTHIIVDKDGTILKVVNKATEMISFLEKTLN